MNILTKNDSLFRKYIAQIHNIGHSLVKRLILNVCDNCVRIHGYIITYFMTFITLCE